MLCCVKNNPVHKTLHFDFTNITVVKYFVNYVSNTYCCVSGNIAQICFTYENIIYAQQLCPLFLYIFLFLLFICHIFYNNNNNKTINLKTLICNVIRVLHILDI